MAANDVDGHLRVTGDTSDLVQSFNQGIDAAKKAEKEITKADDNIAKAEEARAKRTEAAEKRATQATLAGSRERVKELQKEIEQQRVLRKQEDTKQVESKQKGSLEQIKARGERDLKQTFAQRENNRLQALYRLDQAAFEESEKRKTKVFSDQLRVRREEYRKDIKALGPMSQQLQTAINASIGTSNAAYMLGMQAQASGMTPTQLWQQRMNAATARGNAANAAALTTPAFGPPARGGGGRGGGNVFTRLLGGGGGGIAGGIASGLLGGLGVGIGGYAIANIAQGVGADVDRATAYERQTVAARNLAGSQAKLNELLAAYATASGNAVDKVTSLSNVTRLMATGFADTAPEMEKFVRATRGASIALGKPQDYIIQETQLAISNVSVKRLDQIGLGITEVNERIEQLRATNAGWTREMAFQDAVISLLDQKYGKLTKTAEGQATGVEKLRKAWADLRLEVGENAKGPLDDMSEGLSGFLDYLVQIVNDLQEIEERAKRIGAHRSIGGFIVPDAAAGREHFREGFMNYNWTDDSQPVRPSKPKGLSDEQKDLRSQWYTRFQDLETNYNNQRLAEIERYESQRASIIQNYGKMMVREEEDFARQRARGLEDYERSIVKIIKDAQERESEMREALAERVADAREEHEERVSDIQEKYQEDREKALEDHRDRLMKAAGQLDAIAVLEERKRWKRENEEREEGYKDALEKAQENLDEQIEKANEAHEKQLEKARKADEDRLAEMAENRRIQLEREDEDRGIRLERAKQDHDDQLAEMDRLHQETMTKLAKEYEAERTLMTEEFAIAMHDAGIYIEGVAAKLVAKQKLEEEWLEEMIGKYENLLKTEKDPNRHTYDPKTGPNIPLDYGKYLNETAPLPASSSHTSTSRSSSLVINEGAFNIYGAPGQDPSDLANEVEKIVIDLMEDY